MTQNKKKSSARPTKAASTAAKTGKTSRKSTSHLSKCIMITCIAVAVAAAATILICAFIKKSDDEKDLIEARRAAVISDIMKDCKKHEYGDVIAYECTLDHTISADFNGDGTSEELTATIDDSDEDQHQPSESSFYPTDTMVFSINGSEYRARGTVLLDNYFALADLNDDDKFEILVPHAAEVTDSPSEFDVYKLTDGNSMEYVETIFQGEMSFNKETGILTVKSRSGFERPGYYLGNDYELSL